jgi:predicted nucleic acid-binding protein
VTLSTPRVYFDTYALIERLNGHLAYERFAETPVFTHQMNVLELIASLLRDHDEATTRQAIALLAPNLLEAEQDDLFATARFRATHKGLSYVDALGYVLAQKHGMAFLTGDKAFAGVEGVLHVR